MKDRSIYSIFQAHLDDLKKSLSQASLKDNINIMEHLINLLGCVTLGESIKILKSVRSGNYNKITAGTWQKYIEEWIKASSSKKDSKCLSLIRQQFCENDDSGLLKSYIRDWIEFRNMIAHDTILIDEDHLTLKLRRRLFQPAEKLNLFIDSLITVVNKCKSILQSDFFYYQDDILYIFSGIDYDGTVKYKHFKLDPIQLKVKNFPIWSKEVFLSLEPTPENLLLGQDKIEVEMRTSSANRSYDNEFELWVNKNRVSQIHQRFVAGDHISFPVDNFLFEDGNPNLIEVKALRRNKIQAYDSKNISIYSSVPDLNILWESSTGKNIPVDKIYPINLILRSVFPVSDVIVSYENLSEYLEIFGVQPPFLLQDGTYKASLDVHSTNIGKSGIQVNVSYLNRLSEKKSTSAHLTICCTPNFFEPDYFETEDRASIIQKMTEERRTYLITGEGGIGKSRLIQKYLNNIREPVDKLIIKSAYSFFSQLIEFLNLSFDKNEKADKKREKIISSFKRCANLGQNQVIWIQDCHQMRDENDRLLIKDICEITNSTGNNIMLILESRDETDGENARKFIDQMKEIDIRIFPLDRFNEESSLTIIDSIFEPNKFNTDLKQTLIHKSDGVIYILLESLKYLYDQGAFLLEEEIWADHLTDDLKKYPKNINFHRVLKINIDECLSNLDKHQLGHKGRDLLRYLCFGTVAVEVLQQLLDTDLFSLQSMLDVFEDKYLIKRQENSYEFHHQLKRDYCEEKLLPAHIRKNYLIELLPFSDEVPNELFADMESLYNMTEPRLKLKVERVLADMLEVMESYEEGEVQFTLNMLNRYHHVLDFKNVLYLLENVLHYYENWRDQPNSIEQQFRDDFHQLKKIIDHILDTYPYELCSNDDERKYYFAIKIRTGINDLAQTFHEKFNINFSCAEGEDELFTPIFRLTDQFLNDSDFLRETYQILGDIYIYTLLFYEREPDPDHDWSIFGRGKDQDINKSVLHLEGLRILSEPSKKDEYIKGYQQIFETLFSLPPTEFIFHPLLKEFFEYHEENIIKDYSEMLDKMYRYHSYVNDYENSEDESIQDK